MSEASSNVSLVMSLVCSYKCLISFGSGALQAAPGMPSATPFGTGGGGFGGQQHQQQTPPGSGAFSGMQLGGQFDAVAQVSWHHRFQVVSPVVSSSRSSLVVAFSASCNSAGRAM